MNSDSLVVLVAETSAEHPYMLNIERIVRLAPKMTSEEREALAAWAEEALESSMPFDTSAWPGWFALARRLAH